MQTAMKRRRLLKAESFLVMFFGLTSLLVGQPQNAGSLPEPKEDSRQVRRMTRDIAHDKKRLNRDTLKFGANSSQALRDLADLQRDKAALTKAEADVMEDQKEAAQLATDKQERRDLETKIRSDRRTLKSDRSEFGPNSTQVQADIAQLKSDEQSLQVLNRQIRSLHHEEAREEAHDHGHLAQEHPAHSRH